MIVAIYACECTYGGLHGIYSKAVLEVSDIEEARDIAVQMSYEVMDSYEFIVEDIEAEIEYAIHEQGDERDYDEIANEYYSERVEYMIYVPSPELIKGKDISALDEEFYQDEDTFLKKYNCHNI